MDEGRMVSTMMCFYSANEMAHLKSRFKLHLRPKTKSAAHVTNKILPLPRGKTAIDVFADFLRYLYKCAQKYIEETHPNGVKLWENLRPTSEFILTHPNGWEGAQQGILRFTREEQR